MERLVDFYKKVEPVISFSRRKALDEVDKRWNITT